MWFVALLAIFVVDAALICALRMVLARRFRIAGIGFWPWSGAMNKLDGVWRWARPTIVLACFVAVYVMTALAFAAMYWIEGDLETRGRIEVIAGGAAEQAGLRNGDEVVSIDGTRITKWDDVVQTVQKSEGKP